MLNVLSVAEKPSVAKELAAIISKQRPESIRKQGFSNYNPIYDITSCQFKNSNNASMRMTSVSGHMMEIEFDQAYKGWNNCQPVDLFTAPINKDVKKESLNIKKTLVQEARKANVLLLWLDCDLEGENIAYEVITVCCEANPRLDVYRARFSALIERDIIRTLRLPDRPNPHMNDAVEARQEIDLRIGAAFTRFQSLRLQKKFDTGSTSVISFGPCQFPTLGFVVDRNSKIDAFRPEHFWYLTCDVEFDNPDKPGSKLSCSFHWDRSRLYDRLVCAVIYDSCIEDGGVATVIQCNNKPTTKAKPVPMNTIEFQMRASMFLRMASDRAMTIAESLYQRGILSYPRTETNFFKEGTELQALVADHCNHPDWGAFATDLTTNNKFQWPRAGGKDDQAHPPIHPTKSVPLQELQNDEERKVYNLVARHFLACCSSDARGSLTTVNIEIPEGGEKFHASGLMVLERNWLDVYSEYEKWNASKIPVFKVGDTFLPKRLLMSQGKTAPPEHISESELISVMDKNGIGTDATIATHIATIQQREYARKNDKNQFVPTKLGLALVEGYNSMGYQLNKPQLRAVIEADCQRVARGEARKEDVVQKCLSSMRDCFVDCNRDAHKLDAAMEKYFTEKGVGSLDNYTVVKADLSVCGNCHGTMDLRQETGTHANKNHPARYLYCEGCKKAYAVPSRGELLAHEHSCPICRFQVLIVRNMETNKDHTVCPYCFSNPPAAPIGVEGNFEFRCFSCAKEDCILALRTIGTDVDITDCTRCASGKMRLKKIQKGGYMVSCANANCGNDSKPWWVPKFVKSVLPLKDDPCQLCLHRSGSIVLKVKLSFKLDAVPFALPPESIVCPSCDPLWEQTGVTPLPVRLLARRNNTMTTAQPPNGPIQSNAQRGPNQNAAPSIGQQSMMSFLSNNRAATDTNNAVDASTINRGCNTSSSSSSTAPPYRNDYQAALAGMKNNSSNRLPLKGPTPFPTNQASSSNSSYPSHSYQRTNNNSNNMIMNSVTPSDIPQCGCGIPAVSRVVSKEGGNKGRPFFACQKSSDGCKFFVWADEPIGPVAPSNNTYNNNAPSSNTYNNNAFSSGGRTNSNINHTPGNSNNNKNNDSPNENTPLCKCGETAVSLQVRKEGPNMGKFFFACRTKACDFFQWAAPGGISNQQDSLSSRPVPMDTTSGYIANNSYRSHSKPTTTNSSSSYSSGPAGTTKSVQQCKCGEAAISLQVKKEGPNIGRYFHSCRTKK